MYLEVLNELHPLLKLKVQKEKSSREKNFGAIVQVLNFLDVSIILHQNSPSDIDTFYKECNSYD